MTTHPYFSRILSDASCSFEEAFRQNGNVHMGYYADAASRDTSIQTFVSAGEALAERVFAAAGIVDGMRVLDVGCGLGGSLATLNEKHSGMDLVGLNIDSGQLDIACRHVKAHATNRVAFVEGDATHLPFADASFDAMISMECIEHVPNRRQFFLDVRRVLRPGGRFCMTDYIMQNHALPLVAVLAPILTPRLRSFYGDFNPWPCPDLGYQLLARMTGLHEVRNEDITQNVLPSFASLRKIFTDHDAARAMSALQWLCRRKLVRYRMLTFVKATRHSNNPASRYQR